MNVRSDASRSLVATFVTLGLAYGVWYAYSVFLVALAEELHWSAHSCRALPFRAGPRLSSPPSAGSLTGWGAPRFHDGRASWPSLDHRWRDQRPLTSTCLRHPDVARGHRDGLVPRHSDPGLFPRHFGTALGIASAGIGVGIFAVVPFCHGMIDATDGDGPFGILGIVIAVWTIPAAFILVRDPPCLADDARRDTEEPTLAAAAAHGPSGCLRSLSSAATSCARCCCSPGGVPRRPWHSGDDRGDAGGLVVSRRVRQVAAGGRDVIGRRPTFTTAWCSCC